MQCDMNINVKCSVVILAAGLGTRMKSRTPKILHKICGKEMLFCVIDEASLVSDDIHIILFNQSESIINLLSTTYKKNKFNIHIQNYNKYPGTAGAIMRDIGEHTKNLIDVKHEKVLIVNADTPLIQVSKLKELIENDSIACVGVLKLNNTHGYGRVLIEDNHIKKIVEERDASDDIKKIDVVNAGIYCFDKSILNKFLHAIDNNNVQKEFYLTDVIELIARENPVDAIYCNINDFMGVNSKVELVKAEEIMLDRLRNKAINNGVILHMPSSIYIEFGTEFIGECEVECGVVLKGNNKIIDSCIKAHSVIEDSTISNSEIGPFARVRPKSLIQDSSIGNFVEVKASKLLGVKAGHLSYIGDSEINSGTNIGAGVITCNYDGKSKHRTTIGENVFVGSGVQLIAPINVESNSIIAAGSIINKNVNDGDLAISRVRQENKKGFFYSFFGKDKKRE